MKEGKVVLDMERTCFACKNMAICKSFDGVDKFVNQASIFNIDGDAAPCSFMVVFAALANACTRFLLYEK